MAMRVDDAGETVAVEPLRALASSASVSGAWRP